MWGVGEGTVGSGVRLIEINCRWVKGSGRKIDTPRSEWADLLGIYITSDEDVSEELCRE